MGHQQSVCWRAVLVCSCLFVRSFGFLVGLWMVYGLHCSLVYTRTALTSSSPAGTSVAEVQIWCILIHFSLLRILPEFLMFEYGLQFLWVLLPQRWCSSGVPGGHLLFGWFIGADWRQRGYEVGLSCYSNTDTDSVLRRPQDWFQCLLAMD